MPFALVAIRTLLAATVLCSVAAAWPVAFGPEGRELLELDSNRWSGLLGLLVGGSAAVAALGAIAPRWVLAHPAAVALAAIPFVSSLLVRFSSFDNAAMLAWALAATLFAGLAALALLAGAFLARDRPARPGPLQRLTASATPPVGGATGHGLPRHHGNGGSGRRLGPGPRAESSDPDLPEPPLERAITGRWPWQKPETDTAADPV